MFTYIAAFIFYTLAMIGILMIGFIVYKKIGINSLTNNNKGLIKVLDTYPIGAKKSLMVIKIKDECFLIASGVEHTTFLAKLGENSSIPSISPREIENILKENINKSQKNEITINDVKNNDNQFLDKANKTAQIQDMINELNKQTMQASKKAVYDELQQARLNKLQKQFDELYEKEELKEKGQAPRTSEIKIEQRQANNKRMLSKILEELNSSNLKSKGGY